MDDSEYGTRDKRGYWRPNKPLEVAPILVWPWSFRKFLTWLPDYFLPYNLCFFLIGALFWFFLTPAQATLQTLSWDWAAWIFARNAILILVVFGSLELRLYVRRRQGTRFKYNAQFPSEQPARVFMFKNQRIDNIIRTFGTGVPIWSAYEVLILHAWANGWGPWALFGENPVFLIGFGLLIPLIHEVHFYCIHRLIHIPVLYKWVHSVHHKAVNPSPWSSLSMHPVEHLLYWSDALIHLIVPSHPLLLLYHLQVTGTGAIIGHVGFDKVETRHDNAVDTQAYAHYLHHRFFEVNYADGTLPIDKWFGTWHDGSVEGDQQMRARLKQRTEKIARRSGS